MYSLETLGLMKRGGNDGTPLVLGSIIEFMVAMTLPFCVNSTCLIYFTANAVYIFSHIMQQQIPITPRISTSHETLLQFPLY